MVRWTALLLIAAASAKETKTDAGPIEVVVLKAVPAATFRWVGTGNGAVSCLATQCEHYYHQVEPGFPSSDTVLRLLMPDQRIAIVECYAKEVLGVNYAIQLMNGSDADVPIRRVCATPPEGLATEAAFHGNDVRLTVPGAKKNGQPTTELYHIKGFLEPIADDKPASGVQAFVATVPMGAQVFLDGVRVGTSPVQITIPATGGSHIFTIKKDGYGMVQQNVAADSERTRFDFALKAAW